MIYRANVWVGQKTFRAKTEASSVGEAYNKIRSAAASANPGKDIMVMKVRLVVEMPDFLKDIFK